MKTKISKQQMLVARLVATLKKHDAAYYNAKPIISDREYDALRLRLSRLAPNDPYLQSVGAPEPEVRGGTKIVKEKLPIMVGSLGKLRPADVPAWCKEMNRAQAQPYWHLEPKWDGASMLAKYEGGKLVRAWRRGEGDEGGVVTAAAKYIQGVRHSLPPLKTINTKQTILVRSEIVMHRSIFDTFYGPEGSGADLGKVYKTPRNLANGLLNRVNPTKSREHLARCTSIAYHLYVWDKRRKTWVRPVDTHLEWLYLFEMGFTTSMNPTRYSVGHKRLAKKIVTRGPGYNSLRKLLPAHEEGGIGHLCKFESIPTPEQVVDRLNAIRKAVDVPIDGLVIQPALNAAWQKKGEQLERRPAFVQSIKLDAHDQSHADGYIGKIAVEISKRGLIKPVVEMREPLNFDGVDVSNTNAVNFANVVKWGLRAGRKIRVVRSGDVIPRIVGVFDGPKLDKFYPIQERQVVKSRATGQSMTKLVDLAGIRDSRVEATLPKVCPACSTKLQWTKNRAGKKIDLYCSNEKCPGRHGKTVLSFFRTLGVDDVAAGTINHLIAEGFTTVQKILREATVERLVKLEGYQAKKAATVASAISGALKDKPLAKVMHASGAFSSPTFSMGSTKLQDIVDHLGEGAISAELITKLRPRLATLKGIGPSGVDMFLKQLPEWRKFYATIADMHSVSSGPKTLAGTIFCFTGFRDSTAEKFITDRGGRVSGMSGKVNVLFAASVGSAKAQRAAKMGIPIVAESKMWEWLKARGD